MTSPDLNLLIALDVLLTEGNVARAARRLRLSPSATSRALSRLRETTGDPLLVKAGRGLVPTPRGEALKDQVHRLVDDAQAVLRPAAKHEPATLIRTFTLRTSDGFVENFGPQLLARLGDEAPGVRLNFLQKPDKDSTPLREGRVDLETAVVDTQIWPELRTQALFRDRLIGVVRAEHPLADRSVTIDQYAEARHVIVSRSGLEDDAVDLPFMKIEQRRVASVVSGFAAALALARASDLVATVPERHTESLRAGMVSFPIPAPTTSFAVSMIWHPRLDADPAHRWLRERVREICSPRAG